MNPIGVDHSSNPVLPQSFPLLDVILEFVGMTTAMKRYEIPDRVFEIYFVGFLKRKGEKIRHDSVKSAANASSTC